MVLKCKCSTWSSRNHPIFLKWKFWKGSSVQFSSVAQSCPAVCDPMDCSTPGLPVHHQLWEFTQTHVHWVGDAIQPSVLCHPLLLSPSIFPSIRVFSNELALCIRWPKYWSFIFSISPSNEYSGLISFTMDWLDLLAVQWTLKNLLQHHSSKASILQKRGVGNLTLELSKTNTNFKYLFLNLLIRKCYYNSSVTCFSVLLRSFKV